MFKLERYMRVKTRNGQLWIVVDNVQRGEPDIFILTNENDWVLPTGKADNKDSAYIPYEIVEVYDKPSLNRDITVIGRKGNLLWQEVDPRQTRITELEAELEKLKRELN